MSDDIMVIKNLREVEGILEEQLSGTIELSIAEEYLADTNTKYHAQADFTRACDKVLTESNQNVAAEKWAEEGGVWDNGGHYLQDLARQIKAEYVSQVSTDTTLKETFRDLVRRLFRMDERQGV